MKNLVKYLLMINILFLSFIKCDVDNENEKDHTNKINLPIYNSEIKKVNAGEVEIKKNKNKNNQSKFPITSKKSDIKNQQNQIEVIDKDLDFNKKINNINTDNIKINSSKTPNSNPQRLNEESEIYDKSKIDEIIHRAVRTGNSKLLIHYINIDFLNKKELIDLYKNITEEINHNHTSVVQALLNKGIKIDEEITDLNHIDKQNKTLLMFAVSHRTDMFKYILEHGANPRAKDDKNDTVLHHACSRGITSFENLEILLEKTDAIKDINAINNKGETPLDRTHNDYFYEYLVKKGAKHNKPISFSKACYLGNIDLVKTHINRINNTLKNISNKINNLGLELKNCKEINKCKNLKQKISYLECDYSNTKREFRNNINIAISTDNLELFKLLFNQGMKLASEEGAHSSINYLPSHFYQAIEKDRTKVLEYILKNKIPTDFKNLDGLDPKSKVYKLFKKYGYTHGPLPISKEIRRGNGEDIDNIKYLINNYDLKKEGLKPFIMTLKYANNNTIEILELLFKNGLKFEVNEESHKNDDFIDHNSSGFGSDINKKAYSSLELVDECISQYKGNPNNEALKYLFEKGIIKNINRKETIEGFYKYDRKLKKDILIKEKYPFEYLEIYRSITKNYNHSESRFNEMMDILIKYGKLELKTNGFTILHYASKFSGWYPSGSLFFLKYILKLIETKKLNIDINKKDRNGRTPLDYQKVGKLGYQLIYDMGGRHS